MYCLLQQSPLFTNSRSLILYCFCIGRYTLFSLGTYQYNCSGNGYGNVITVSAKHSIALCKQCSDGSKFQSSHVHSINVGDLVEWSVATEMQGQSHNCTMLISQLLGGNQSMYSYAYLLQQQQKKISSNSSANSYMHI